MNSLFNDPGVLARNMIKTAATLTNGINIKIIPNINCQRLRDNFSRFSGHSFAKLTEQFIALYLCVCKNIAIRNNKRDGINKPK